VNDQPGFVTVDICTQPSHGVFAKDRFGNAVARGYFQQIFAKNVLELVAWADLADTLLEWNDLLEKTGQLYLRTIDMAAVLGEIIGHPQYYGQVALAANFFMSGSTYYDTRLLGFTEATLKTQLMAAGFTIAHVDRAPGHAFEIEARKSIDWSSIAADKADDDAFIRACYAEILFREPSDKALALEAGWLKRREITRRAAIKKLLASEERRLTIARLHGF
jgi:hypothetical protein